MVFRTLGTYKMLRDMSDILNFAFSEVYRSMRGTRSARCGEIATEMERLATSAANETRSSCVELARQLRVLADDLEHASANGSTFPRTSPDR